MTSTTTDHDPAAAEETVRQLVERRLPGDDGRRVLDMLFQEPEKRIYISPSKLRQGRPLTVDEKAQIRELGGKGLLHSAIADIVGVTRQAVTGVLASTGRQ
jgi:hypothetical protein